ncbi:hypothetical protein F5887DRAFT_1072933 [Amanita rubescens]|nr:hypothetical protein F5887DRAFT_1072933 [Amanita rubescens]
MLPTQSSTNSSHTRYLPTYEETNAPYSLRLPAYRSSYIHRFHPYARVSMSFFEERYIVSGLIPDLRWVAFDQAKDPDDRDYGDNNEGCLLDLSILDEPIASMSVTPMATSDNARSAHHNQEVQIGEQSDVRPEIPSVIVDPDMINVHLNEQEDEQEDVEHPRQPSPFLRIDVMEPRFESL